MHTSAILIAGIALMSGCSDSSAPVKPSALGTIKIVSGASQSGTVGTTLTTAVTVQATDSNGQQANNVYVLFQPTGGGSVGSPTDSTDSLGKANTTWTLDTIAGRQGLLVTVGDRRDLNDLVTDTVFATATPGPVTSLTKSGGDQQAGAVNTLLATALAVTATDQYGNPTPGVTVSWTITSGGGAVQPTSSATNASGVAQTQWTLGPSAGANSVSASATGTTPATFNATGS